jgi:hypothetical protein
MDIRQGEYQGAGVRGLFVRFGVSDSYETCARLGGSDPGPRRLPN